MRNWARHGGMQLSLLCAYSVCASAWPASNPTLFQTEGHSDCLIANDQCCAGVSMLLDEAN